MEITDLTAPGPVKIFESGKTKVLIYENSSDAAMASVLNVIKKQIILVKEKSQTSIMVMAAPSGYDFYEEYTNMAKHCRELQSALKNTHFFQLDEYFLPENHPASFRFLLKQKLFSRISDYTDDSKIHLLAAESVKSQKVCNEYKDLLLKYGPDIQIKGQGEDAHWGFNQPGTVWDSTPAIIKIKLNHINKIQQMRDHPKLYPTIDDVPDFALTGNVSLFMKTKFLIEDIVPQESKAFATLISYANECMEPLCPSGKIKEYTGESVARLTMKSAWALIEYRKKGYLSGESITRLERIWNKTGDLSVVNIDNKYIRNALDSLGISYRDS
jgi:glucosamine-6-phosphate deaminase